MSKRWLAILALPLLTAACTQRGYTAKPIAGENDVREVEIPDLGDEEARRNQKCFIIEIYASNDYQDEGIACMVEPERNPR